uniref:Uncharacterized protein n=1 Tax=Sparus aurata TaxID=8175 RepID=A0A671TVH0_SPAAU
MLETTSERPWVFSADGEGDVIYGELDSPCVGHGLASPVVVLHSHLERHKPGLLRAQSHQLIYTRALEVKPMAIKTRGVTNGSAGTLSIHHSAPLLGRAGRLAAGHHAQGRITLT